MSRVSNNVNSIFNDSLNFPDFSACGYALESVLGHNLSGGRITYKGKKNKNQQHVVIKQFQFATVGASWSSFAEFEHEIEMLQHLDHPQIPKCLDCFETDTGFCIVLEYINARCLGEALKAPGSGILSLSDNVKKIAVGVLKILVYLQQQVPSVIHRDIKPENILVDQQFNVHLVDFGIAKISGETMGASTMVKGTLGFMAPEQMFGRPLNNSSDLYSLGATLICLLTQTESSQVGNLIDDSFRFKIQQLLPELNVHWIDWLEKMVAPSQAQRFPDAATALSSLLAIDTINLDNTSKLDYKYPLAFALSLSALSLGLMSAVLLHTLEPKQQPIFVPIERLPKYSMKKPELKKRLRKLDKCDNCHLRYTDLREKDLRTMKFENIDLGTSEKH